MTADDHAAASAPTTAADDKNVNTGNDDEPVVGSRDKNVPWYDEVLENLSPQTRALLEGYSGIAPDEVLNHVYRVVSFLLLFLSAPLFFAVVLLLRFFPGSVSISSCDLKAFPRMLRRVLSPRFG